MHTEHLKKNFANWRKYFLVLERDPQRSIAIVRTAVFEDLVDSYLKVYFSNFEEEHFNLFGYNSPVGTFVAKARLCYVLRLLSKTEFSALKLIAKIRNDFAHKVDCDFSSKAVNKHTRALGKLVEIIDDGRQPDMAKIVEEYEAAEDAQFVFLMATGKLSHDLLYRLDEIADHTRNAHATKDFTSPVEAP